MPEGPKASAIGPMPSFIIGGAAKAGTSSLHEMLTRLPGVFIPDHELYLFAIDDFEQHPDFFVGPDGSWIERGYDAHRAEYLAWYSSFFADAPAGAILGEDSTSYLPSTRAATRIHSELPDVKLVFLLRDPASRTYSQYWHDLRVGRIVEGFEATLRHAPGTLLQRSRYLEQIRRYLDLFPREQVTFHLFEAMVEDPAPTLTAVARFIGATVPADLRLDEIHRNPARVPRSLRFQLWRNRLVRDRTAARFRGHLPGSAAGMGLRERAVRGRWAAWNLDTNRRPPAMAPETRRFLDDLFRSENAGLADLIGLDVDRYWYSPKGVRRSPR